MKIVMGDLISLAEEGQFDVIVHGCNCHHAMNRGIAAELRKKYPEVYESDKLTKYGLKEKLGTIFPVYVHGYRKIIDPTLSIGSYENKFFIVNAYTQFYYARFPGEIVVSYNAIRSCFAKIKQHFSNKRIAYPKIGCGLGGGNWEIVSRIIDEELQGCDHTLVLLEND